MDRPSVDRAAFDRVVIHTASGELRSYSAEEFLALPLATRIQHILAREVEFFRGHYRLERTEALQSLRR